MTGAQLVENGRKDNNELRNKRIRSLFTLVYVAGGCEFACCDCGETAVSNGKSLIENG
ncbi:MAG: hypothetical protein GY805_18700 [Chloroflexi bacterium]|nr:hypothetical protein [Chloroflexota bacterium]